MGLLGTKGLELIDLLVGFQQLTSITHLFPSGRDHFFAAASSGVCGSSGGNHIGASKKE